MQDLIADRVWFEVVRPDAEPSLLASFKVEPFWGNHPAATGRPITAVVELGGSLVEVEFAFLACLRGQATYEARRWSSLDPTAPSPEHASRLTSALPPAAS